MPQPPSLVPAYCLHRPTGQAFVTIRLDGKRAALYLGKFGTPDSFTAYQDRLTEAGYPPSVVARSVSLARSRSADPDRQPDPETATVFTVRHLWAAFSQWAPSYYRLPTGRPSRELDNFRDSVRELLERFGEHPAAAFTKQHMEQVRDAMLARNLSRGVINKRVARILRVFRWGTEEGRGLVPEAVAAALHLIRKLQPHRTTAPEPPPVAGAPTEHIERAIRSANPVIAAMMQLQLLTGMRPGEVRGLRKRMVVGQGEQWVADFGIEHKMAHRRQTRVVPLGPKAVALLTPWLDACPSPESFVFRPTQQKGSRGHLQQFTRYGYGDSVAWACRKASVPAFAPNQIRHTVGEEVRKTHGLEFVQALLGHRSRASSERYAPVVESLAVEVVRKRG